ncbi:MAG: hormogonium polysaccharide biosynthesis protein HpsA, partial [Leptolyngbyaceae cyanobacterium MO_188.B28]|nr:hormogonium polysaccharide biosynthesis protein HpsA [Leptolyngbyaceae cyanobacterium MO_188.B28]
DVNTVYDDTDFGVTADSLNNLYTAIENTNAWYRLPIEQRQPLEVRVTQISIDDLRKNRADTGNSIDSDEYMLPNSGIIYASRNDGLADDSDPGEIRLSANDFVLDPTRRTNGVMLINGQRLARTDSDGDSNDFREVEKGLTLVSNLPVYVKGEFNPHKDAGGAAQEEFTVALTSNYSNFYTRGQEDANNNFACRKGDPRLPATSCLDPDEWRTGNILSDAVTLLSSGFAEGTRADGDFDLRNNQTDNLSDPDGDSTDEISKASEIIEARLHNGFWNNNFITSHDFTDVKYSAGTGYSDADDSSYFNNFMTPVQRRVAFPEYIMEICRKLPVSDCGREDWVVGFDANGDGILTGGELTVQANQLGAQLAAAGKSDGGNDVFENAEVGWSTAYTTNGNSKSPLERLGAGTTARPALVHEDIDGDGILDSSPINEDINGNGLLDDDWRYPRRVAFARNRYGKLALTDVNSNGTAKPMGVGCPLDSTGNEADNNGCQYKDSTGWTAGTHYGVSANNALWFRTTKDTSGDPDNTAEIVYRADRPLYYEDPVGDGGKIILPDTQCFTNTAIVACGGSQVNGTVNLNLPTTDKASDYTLCLDSNGGPNAGQAKLKYKVGAGDLGNPACGAAPRNAIDDAIGQGSSSGIKQFTDNVSTGNGWTVSGNQITGGTLNAEGPVTVYDLPKKEFESGATITLNANGQTKPVFVLRADNNTDFGDCDGCNGVQLELVGVDPNDIFWYANGIRMKDANASNPHRLAGNFIGNNAAPQMGDYTHIDGGRFLGYTTAPNFPTGLTITAVTADGQPLLTPVLQTQYPAISSPRTDDNALTAPQSQTVVENTNWIQKPTAGTTIFNMVMASGDVPNRPPFTATGLSGNQHLGDYNGGLPNLPRFLENWGKSGAAATTQIRGSLIQLKRSEVATAPFFSLGEKRSSGGYTTGGPFGYPQIYTQSNGGGRMPFFTPPGRDWGFDVGLLSQIPDLLAQQFLAEPASEPNQYFREVGRGDDWIQTLLCAKALNSSGAEVGDAINSDQRPTTFCQQKSSDLP